MVKSRRSPTSTFICALSLILAVALCLLFASPASALSATGQRVLIVTSTAGEASSKYSALSQQLEGRGFSVAHRAANGDEGANNQLTEYDDRRYDHIVFLADDVKSEWAASGAPSKPQSILTSISLLHDARTHQRPLSSIPRRLQQSRRQHRLWLLSLTRRLVPRPCSRVLP